MKMFVINDDKEILIRLNWQAYSVLPNAVGLFDPNGSNLIC